MCRENAKNWLCCVEGGSIKAADFIFVLVLKSEWRGVSKSYISTKKAIMH